MRYLAKHNLGKHVMYVVCVEHRETQPRQACQAHQCRACMLFQPSLVDVIAFSTDADVFRLAASSCPARQAVSSLLGRTSGPVVLSAAGVAGAWRHVDGMLDWAACLRDLSSIQISGTHTIATLGDWKNFLEAARTVLGQCPQKRLALATFTFSPDDATKVFSKVDENYSCYSIENQSISYEFEDTFDVPPLVTVNCSLAVHHMYDHMDEQFIALVLNPDFEAMDDILSEIFERFDVIAVSYDIADLSLRSGLYRIHDVQNGGFCSTSGRGFCSKEFIQVVPESKLAGYLCTSMPIPFILGISEKRYL